MPVLYNRGGLYLEGMTMKIEGEEPQPEAVSTPQS
jgi:hypothetical protein